MQSFIGLAGRKHSGKSEVAKILGQHFQKSGVPVQVLSFASPLKCMLETLGIPKEAIYGKDKEKPLEGYGGITGRHLMVTLGTEWGRKLVHQDIWIFALAQKAKNLEGIIVIDDVRFESELHWLQSQKDATILGVERGELPGRMEDQHISEQLPYRFAELGIPIIKNDSTLAELHQKVIALAVPNP